MLKNKNFKALAQQYTNKYNLNLQGFNVLVPAIDQEPLLLGILAGIAGAGNIYIFDSKININQTYVSEEFGFSVKFVGSVSAELLSGLNIILKDSQMPLQGEKIACFAKKSSVISMFPENMEFANPKNLDPELIQKKDLSIIGLDTEDPKLGLYQQFSHMIIKKCYSLAIDIFKSKILLIGHGNFLNCTLSLLKSAGAVVYTYNTNTNSDQSYVLKHLKDLDAIIAMDYPLTGSQLIGSKGIISICDIVDYCPLVKVIHVCGKIETGSLKLGNIKYLPESIEQELINLKMKELGERGITELATLSLKIAEDFLKSGKNTLTSGKSVVTYKLLNNASSLLSGGKI